MNKPATYTLEEIEDRLQLAIKKLQEKDKLFLDPKFDINERTVTHRLGMYLAEYFPDEDVDCEYNRALNEACDEYIAKNVDVPVIEQGLPTHDLEARTVFPDVIVHKRETLKNILAVEVKMDWKKSKADFDITKLEGYKWILKYEYAAFLVLGPGEDYQIKFIGND